MVAAFQPATAAASLDVALPEGDFWVFGYGSLMWRPGFAYQEVCGARLYGYHRALCVWSWVHRGTQAQPGLVFGLDAGGSCVGRAFRVAVAERAAVLHYLHQREMVTAVYHPAAHRLHLNDRRVVKGLCFLVDRQHQQYAGRLEAETAAAVVATASGMSGANRDYLDSTVEHLEDLGIREPLLLRIRDLVQEC